MFNWINNLRLDEEYDLIYVYWNRASEKFWQRRYEKWVEEQRNNPKFMEVYLKYKDNIKENQEYPDWYS